MRRTSEVVSSLQTAVKMSIYWTKCTGTERAWTHLLFYSILFTIQPLDAAASPRIFY